MKEVGFLNGLVGLTKIPKECFRCGWPLVQGLKVSSKAVIQRKVCAVCGHINFSNRLGKIRKKTRSLL